MTQGAEIVAYARTLIGLPHHATSHESELALSCIGILFSIAKRFDFPIIDLAAEGQPNLFVDVERMVSRVLEPADGPEPGGVFVLGTGRNHSTPGRAHFAVLTDDSKWQPFGMIHSTRLTGGVIEERFPNSWLKYKHLFCRFPGVE